LSGGPDVGPASEFKHPIQGGSSNGAPGRLGLGGARSRRIADHAPAGNKRGSVQQGRVHKKLRIFPRLLTGANTYRPCRPGPLFRNRFPSFARMPVCSLAESVEIQAKGENSLAIEADMGGIGQFDLPFGERPDQGG
jgi:hypothetical protein